MNHIEVIEGLEKHRDLIIETRKEIIPESQHSDIVVIINNAISLLRSAYGN